jgi:hypothetical protein
MRLLGTTVLGVLAATLIDCGGKSNDQNVARNNTAPDAAPSDAAAQLDASEGDAAQGTAGSSSNGGANGQGGQGNADAGGSNPQGACVDAADEAFALVGDSCSGSDVCVYPNTQIVGACEGTYVTACTSGTWTSQCFVGNVDAGPLECTDLDGADAGALAMRECSDSVLKPVLWARGNLANGQESCGPIPLQTGCMLPWGCSSFQNARTNLAQCDGGPFVSQEQSARGWGFLILEDHQGQVVRRGYYNETTGALVGTWTRQGLEESCAGSVPRLSFDNGEITNRVQLCLPDGGVIGGDGDGG